MACPKVSLPSCQDVVQSQACDAVRKTSTLTILALSVLAVIAGVILLLAQQGFNLHGINSLATMVRPEWLYLGMGIAGVGLVASSVFIVAAMRSKGQHQ